LIQPCCHFFSINCQSRHSLFSPPDSKLRDAETVRRTNAF
jgi:hypothetical protein